MKVQVFYSSLSGCTEKVAKAIYDNLETSNKTINNINDDNIIIDGDIILLGYWVDKGGPNEKMKEFMKSVSGKAVGIFCTLAYYADSVHGVQSLQTGIDELKNNNTIIGSYVCNGALSEKLIEKFRNASSDGTHASSPQSEIRWDIMNSHPTKCELSLASERFNERIEMYQKHTEQKLVFKSIM